MFSSTRALAVASLSALLGLSALPASAQTPYLGEIKCFGYNFVPQGWAALNGQLMSIAQNTALFSLLGTQFGGDGIQTFALPDMQGRTLIEVGNGAGLSSHVVGESAGNETTGLTIANLPPHTHTFAPLGSTNDASSVSPAGQVASSKARTTLYTSPSGIVTMASGVTSATGSGVPINNMQPYLAVTCAIALQGIYPSRD
ncbi:phage tail protein [Solimicrobium silvestre]|uniref:Microcystin-dependent protein n=1 Tax=Solimicrobium silvestre TaxID=2099400 RepID=A0A2S9GZ45_9BURK|nr:tail fiber protein [Solimicrobium silvestre]PRC92977.1 Microcystin-dependent protein [Solimicrobium silvestre]